ncbi:MAG: Chemotaxis protein CheW [candidate division BRC1 bacterium ADurb.BinA364]|nr:MAG: Chemotaxis protein CheW [candidate division BRC1 bacterium ADurb.BinA364]
MERQFSTFFIGDDLFGIDILMVNEINRNLDITPVEKAPDYVRGLMNLRGQIVTVLDLGVRLGMGPREIGSKSRCIVLKVSSDLKAHQAAGRLRDDTANDVVGLLVDRVGDMVAVDEAEIEPPPANVNGVEGKYLSGVVKLPDALMVTLRAREVLDSRA